MSENVTLFHRRCGEILRMRAGLEQGLEFFLANYFVWPQDEKTFTLRDFVLSERLTFEAKKQVFCKICKKEKIDEELRKRTLTAIDYVKNIGNRVAHEEAAIEDPRIGQIILRPKKRIVYHDERLEVTDELVKNVDAHRLQAIQGVTAIHLELINRKPKGNEVKVI